MNHQKRLRTLRRFGTVKTHHFWYDPELGGDVYRALLFNQKNLLRASMGLSRFSAVKSLYSGYMDMVWNQCLMEEVFKNGKE